MTPRFNFLYAFLILATFTSPLMSETSPQPWSQTYPLTQINKPAELTNLADPQTQHFLTADKARLERYQIDPLQAIVSVDYPDSILSIRDAARWTLKSIGYSLVEQGSRTAPELQILLDAPLPVVQRQLHQVPVSEVLRALAGIGHVVVVDHVYRLVTFDPRPLYAQLPAHTQSSTPLVSNTIPTEPPRPVVIVPTVPIDKSTSRNPESDGQSIRQRPGLLKPSRDMASSNNVTLLGRSHFSDTYEDYVELMGQVLAFSPDSSSIQISQLKHIELIADAFEANTDLISVIGCANDTPSDRRTNQSLAEARTLTVKDQLIASGISKDRILDEACWSNDEENLPNHGAIVALKRLRGGE